MTEAAETAAGLLYSRCDFVDGRLRTNSGVKLLSRGWSQRTQPNGHRGIFIERQARGTAVARVGDETGQAHPCCRPDTEATFDSRPTALLQSAESSLFLGFLEFQPLRDLRDGGVQLRDICILHPPSCGETCHPKRRPETFETALAALIPERDRYHCRHGRHGFSCSYREKVSSPLRQQGRDSTVEARCETCLTGMSRY